MNNELDSVRVGLVLTPRDVVGMDRAAAAEELTRSCWLRRLIRQRLRELNAATKTGAPTCS